MLSDHDALLAAVAANFDDDTPKLVMADWYTENNQPDRGEFIRVQIAIKNHRPCHWHRLPSESKLCHVGSLTTCALCAERHELEERERKLQYAATTDGGWMRPIGMTTYLRGIDRGFLVDVGCQFADWPRHGPSLVAQHPITYVKIINKEPYAQNIGRVWYDAERHLPSPVVPATAELPRVVFRLLKGDEIFPQIRWKIWFDRATAERALSEALIQWAKDGCPPQ